MRESDLAELIPPTRIREAFRQKLLEWQILVIFESIKFKYNIC